jgi:Do/DeqQ family serine protease
MLSNSKNRKIINRIKMKKLLGITLVAMLGGLISVSIYKHFEDEDGAQHITRVVEQTPITYANYAPANSGSLDFTTAAEKTVNSVVHIQTETVVQASGNPWMDMFGSMPPQSFGGSGSGVIISNDGYIVTNNHVIDGAHKLKVTLNDNRTIEAEVIGADPAFDLALIKVDETDLPFVMFANSDDVKIGEWVLAVGNPFNLTSTVTAGIVSAKARNINLLDADPNREIFPVESFIQTDAAVNPGNSGGALVNTRGELIGINTAIASRTGSYSGYSFAVPSSIVQKVTSDLLEYGNVQRAYIGVSITNLNQSIADQLGIDEVEGVYVNGLTPDGAAASVGIEVGDIITAVNDKEIDNVAGLQEQISKYRPGDKVQVSVIRGNKEKLYSVVVRDRQGRTAINDRSTETTRTESFGAIFEEATSD